MSGSMNMGEAASATSSVGNTVASSIPMLVPVKSNMIKVPARMKNWEAVELKPTIQYTIRDCRKGNRMRRGS